MTFESQHAVSSEKSTRPHNKHGTNSEEVTKWDYDVQSTSILKSEIVIDS